MGWRFRKRVGFGKLLRLNFSKSGISLGIGPPGLNLNVGSRGVRTTVGLPGSGLSYQTFKSWGGDARASKQQFVADWQARANAMVADWRQQYVGNVYEGDAGRGVTERLVITDVKLGKDGPLISVAFNPRRVDGKLVYDNPYDYSMESFAKFASWTQVEAEGKPVIEASSAQGQGVASPNPHPEPPATTSSSGIGRFALAAVTIGAILVGAWVVSGESQRRSSTASPIASGPASATAATPNRGAGVLPGPDPTIAQPALTDAASIREVQAILTDLGYDSGPIDGIDGPLTHKAIHNYLVARGLAGTDEPTAALLVRLRSDKSTCLAGPSC